MEVSILTKIVSLNIAYENEEILVVDKPAGLVVNRSQTIKEETLQDQLAKYFGLKEDDLGIGDRAGIVHRLDRETSGLLVVAKTQKAFDFLQKQFAARLVEKEYIALVHGLSKEEKGEVFAEIGRVGRFGKFGNVPGGRESSSKYLVIKKYKFDKKKFQDLFSSSSEPPVGWESRSLNSMSSRLRSNNKTVFSKSRLRYLLQNAQDYSLVRIFPKTGRTHQVRVHLKLLHHPVVSDLIYTQAKLLKFDLLWCPRLFLHASHLEFVHPSTKKPISFSSNLPNDLENAMLNLEVVNAERLTSKD